MKALIFDVDGTLADTEKDGHRIAFNEAFAEAGLDWNWDIELYGELLAITGGKERIRNYIQRFNIQVENDVNLEEFIANLHKTKTKHYKALISAGQIPLRPGVERLLKEARANQARMAIATTTTMVNVTTLLTNTLGEESLEWFEVIGAGDIVENKKPAPDIYQWVLQQMHIDAAEAIAFEDSENGVKSAFDANIKRIVVTTNDYTQNHDFSGATIIANNLDEQIAGAQKIDLAWLQTL